MPDNFDALLLNAEYPVSILGNPTTGDFELIDLTAPLPEDLRVRINERSLCFLGTVGIVNGVPRSALDEPLDPATVDALADAYVAHVQAALTAKLEIGWLERMFGDAPIH